MAPRSRGTASRARWVLLVLWMLTLGAPAVAQETEAEPAPASDVRTDPETGERYRLARPEEPIRQGPLQVEPWVIYVAGALVASAAAGWLIHRLRRS